MTANRQREIEQLLEACQQTDNSDLGAEKTAAIAELLLVIQGLEGLANGGSGDK